MTQHALIIVDIQNDYFTDGKWPLVNMEAASANAAKILEHARALEQLIIHVRHENLEAEAPFFRPDTSGAQIHPIVAPQPNETVIVKNQVNAFKDTKLGALLEWHDIQSVTVVGSMSHMCIDAATRAASDLGYEVTVIEDACATHDMEFNGETIAASAVHGSFMFALEFAYANVTTTEQYLQSV